MCVCVNSDFVQLSTSYVWTGVCLYVLIQENLTWYDCTLLINKYVPYTLLICSIMLILLYTYVSRIFAAISLDHIKMNYYMWSVDRINTKVHIPQLLAVRCVQVWFLQGLRAINTSISVICQCSKTHCEFVYTFLFRNLQQYTQF